MSIRKKIYDTLELVKFSHSLFALPFALASLFIATHGHPSLILLIKIIIAMVTARNTAMAFNRLVDLQYDKKNPRTATRPLASGALTIRYAFIFCLINALLFIGVTFFINPLCFWLSLPTLLILCSYSLAKRVTDFTQIILGISLGLAPIAAAIAATGKLLPYSLLMGLGVLFWVAGFDLLYALQDHDFDKNNQLHSLVVRYGVPRSLILSRIFHATAVGFFFLTGMINNNDLIYFITVFMIALALIFEHTLVKADDLSRLNSAFFTVNGFIGILYFLGVLASLFPLF